MTWPFRERRPWVYGHRGVRDPAPENTMLAFEQALERGADGVEFDVQTSRDGKAVVFHDETLERMTKGRDIRAISSVSATELCAIELDQGTSPPRLSDVLRWAEGNRLFINLELKCVGDNVLPLLDAVEDDILECASASVRARIIVSSFSEEAISRLSSRAWCLRSARLIDKNEPFRVPVPTCSGLHPHFSSIRGVDDLNSTNKSFVNAWTVNDRATAQFLDFCGVDGIITDEIDTVLNALRK